MRTICIEGIDAVGKETISKALETELREKGYRVKRVSFPNYDGSIGKAIKDVLMGKCGAAPSLDPNLVSPFYTMDRLSYFKDNIEDLINNYDYIIMDRSFYSNLMYQASKFYIKRMSTENPIVYRNDFNLFGMSRHTVRDIAKWIFKNYAWEFIDTGLCRCDNIFTIILSMSEESSKKQLENRKEKDTNETDRMYLQGCKEFISILLDDRYKYNIRREIMIPGFTNSPAMNVYNAAHYYISNVEPVEVEHVDNPELIPTASTQAVCKIMKILKDNDMFDNGGDDTDGEN